MANGPGKSHRKGLTLLEVADMFPTEQAAYRWFEKRRWPEGPVCPRCGTKNAQAGIRHRTMTHRCRDCPGKPQFSLKSRTIMEGTKLSWRVWAIAVYLLSTSMKMHRDLGITQKSAWFLAHRLRKSFEKGAVAVGGPVRSMRPTWTGSGSN